MIFTRSFGFARLAALVATIGLAGCSTAKVVSETPAAAATMARPTAIYVADFQLAPGAIKSGSLFAALPLHRAREQSRARTLAADLSQDVVEDLAKQGLSVRRLDPNEPVPRQGWLVQGAIDDVDEGNRLSRAVVGFGAGGTDLKVSIEVRDMAAEAGVSRVDQLSTDARSGKGPGAVLTLNPYAAALKFALSGRDLGQNSHKTAAQIADRVASAVKAQKGPSPPT